MTTWLEWSSGQRRWWSAVSLRQGPPHPNGQGPGRPEKPRSVSPLQHRKDGLPRGMHGVIPSIVLAKQWDPEQRLGSTRELLPRPRIIPMPADIIRHHRANKAHARPAAVERSPAWPTADRRSSTPVGKVVCSCDWRKCAQVPCVRAGYGYGEYADGDPSVAERMPKPWPGRARVSADAPTGRSTPVTGSQPRRHVGHGPVSGLSRGAGYDLDVFCPRWRRPPSTRSRSGNASGARALGEHLPGRLRSCDQQQVRGQIGRARRWWDVCRPPRPGAVRAGGAPNTVDGWFLPDGGTSESSSYAMMTMPAFRIWGCCCAITRTSGLRRPGRPSPRSLRLVSRHALRRLLAEPHSGPSGRSAPHAFRRRLPQQLDRVVLRQLIALPYPPDEHIAFLKELAGKDLPAAPVSGPFSSASPGSESRAVRLLRCPTLCFVPRQSYLRTGTAGRSSLALLNASNWAPSSPGQPHLYYWKDGRELLFRSRLLVGHLIVPDASHGRPQPRDVDGQDQKTAGRDGSVHLFASLCG